MKKILILLVLCVCLASCLTKPIGGSRSESITTTEGARFSNTEEGHFQTCWIDRHQYVRFTNGYQGGIAHAGTCPCWNEMMRALIDSINASK